VYFFGKPERRDNFEELGIDESILKCIKNSKKTGRADLSSSGLRQMAGSCEHEHFGSNNAMNFLNS
jgi:hypothetical protein